MYAYRIVRDTFSLIVPTNGSLGSFLVLAGLLCMCQNPSRADAGAAPPPSQPSPPLSSPYNNRVNPQRDGQTHEDYNLPQEQWGHAYRDGLRQGYDAGRLFPRQLDEAYRQGLSDGYQAWQYYDEDSQRAQRLYRTRDEAIKAGLQAFNQASYDEAADLFVLATQLDNGDPACRLYAAQALFASQQYEQAIPLLRRAFDLQPNMLYRRFDLRLDYGDPADLAAQLKDLQALLATNPDWAGGHLLLGYEMLHSGRRADAYQAFVRATQLDPTDTLSRKFLKVSYPVPTKVAPKAAAPATPPGPIFRPKAPPQPATVAPTAAHKA
jgi:tetratricopeptide (TPR) repeat protein